MYPAYPAGGFVPQPEIDLEPRRFTFNKNYLFAAPFRGILRLLIILATLGAWIAMTCVFKHKFANDKFSDTRIAFLIIAITAFEVSILIFILDVLNIIDFSGNMLRKLFIVAIDLFFALGLIGVGIPAAVMEKKLPGSNEAYMAATGSYWFRYGSFAAAAALAFLAAIFKLISAAAHLIA